MCDDNQRAVFQLSGLTSGVNTARENEKQKKTVVGVWHSSHSSSIGSRSRLPLNVLCFLEIFVYASFVYDVHLYLFGTTFAYFGCCCCSAIHSPVNRQTAFVCFFFVFSKTKKKKKKNDKFKLKNKSTETTHTHAPHSHIYKQTNTHLTN